MKDIFYYAFYNLCVALFGSYTMMLQRATLYWGRKLVSENGEPSTGLQNALTPNSQNYRNILAPILLISTAIIGIIIFDLITGILGMIATIILSAFCGRLFPKKESEYYYNKMLKILDKKKELAKKHDEDYKVLAAEEVLTLLNSIKRK